MLSFSMEVLFFQSLMLLCFFYFPLASCLTQTNASAFPQTLCHNYESLSLLQFKESIQLGDGPSKLQSWNLDTDCCSWDGIECHNNTGYVIGLDLSSSFFEGSITSSSSLFHLVHIRRLSLADNYFNQSPIPRGIKNLSRLTSLNLSFSGFAGQIPSEVLELTRLVSLDLSGNQLWLQSPSLDDLVMKGTNLRALVLHGVNISSPVPQAMAGLSNLTTLTLKDCGLLGQFPPQIFQLPKLQILRLQNNPFLEGSLPEFHRSGSIEVLALGNTSFSGELPKSIHALKSLTALDIRNCRFSGLIPSSIGQLTKLTSLVLLGNEFSGEIPSSFANLTELRGLGLSRNNLRGEIPSSLGYLTQLSLLFLDTNKFTGQFPTFLQNLTNLSQFSLDDNQLTGQLPTWIGNLSRLISLDIGGNRFNGPIPVSIFNLANLQVLYLHDNLFVGTLEFESFLKLKSLNELQLSRIHLNVSSNVTNVQKFINLELIQCNLTEFPGFLRQQDQLEILDLSGNQIHGQIPRWMLDVGKESLTYLGLTNNFLSGFDQAPAVLPWTNLKILDLESNIFQSPIPSPPPFIFGYKVANNLLTGDISPLICNLSSIQILHMSSNRFNGQIPRCLAQLSTTLMFLSLRNNSFQGTIPEICTKGSSMGIIDISQNQLQGQLPRSLAECRMLEALNLANNQINDKFPSWLGTIPGLRALMLGHNNFYGAIQKPEDVEEFQSLRIVDLSFNSLEGDLPSELFKNWNAMKAVDSANLSYLETFTKKKFSTHIWSNYFLFSASITNKGKETDYAQVQDFLVVIDFSNNRFRGEIPGELWGLKSLISLDLSNNLLTGEISAAIANLSTLEALDFSCNEFSGNIPPELAHLTFLGFLNLSENHLSGPIPGGNQLATFQNDSYTGNPDLCGTPLSKRCGEVESPVEEEDGESEPVMEWEAVLVGVGIGLVIGIVLGHAFIRRPGANINGWILNYC